MSSSISMNETSGVTEMSLFHGQFVRETQWMHFGLGSMYFAGSLSSSWIFLYRPRYFLRAVRTSRRHSGIFLTPLHHVSNLQSYDSAKHRRSRNQSYYNRPVVRFKCPVWLVGCLYGVFGQVRKAWICESCGRDVRAEATTGCLRGDGNYK